MPMRRICSPCCARAESGHAAAPPRSDMNSRLFMSVPKLRRQHLIGSNECFDRGWNRHQKLPQCTANVASLIGRLGSSAFKPSATTFQTIHYCSVDVAHGLALLFGIGTKALPLWDSRTRRNNLLGDLAVRVTAGSSDITNSPHPSSREGHLSTAWWNSSFLLSDLILHGFHAAAAACSRVQRNSVPSTHIRCMITANRRARATIAFFIPRRLAICIAQALSHDHFFECSML